MAKKTATEKPIAAKEPKPKAAAKVKCPSCKKSYPEGTKFCPEDGTKLAANVPKCSKCGKTFPIGTKFCPEDGTNLGAEEVSKPREAEPPKPEPKPEKPKRWTEDQIGKRVGTSYGNVYVYDNVGNTVEIEVFDSDTYISHMAKRKIASEKGERVPQNCQVRSVRWLRNKVAVTVVDEKENWETRLYNSTGANDYKVHSKVLH